MTDRAEDICPQCHLPMHRDDARSYGYGGPTHEVSRCVELLLFANRAQAAEVERATEYAGKIANYLARRREAGGFELLPDLMGVLTQIDHMVATLPKEQQP